MQQKKGGIDRKTFGELSAAGRIELDCLRDNLVEEMSAIGKALSHLDGESGYSYRRGYIVGMLHGFEFAIDNIDMRRRIVTTQVLAQHPEYADCAEFSSYIGERLKRLEHDAAQIG